MRPSTLLLLIAAALLLTAGCIGQRAGPPATTAPAVTIEGPAAAAEAPIDVEIEGLMPPANAAEPELPVPDFGGDEGVDLGSVL